MSMTARQRAAASGHNKYLGRECPHGHRLRYTRSMDCVICSELYRDARKLAPAPVVGTMNIVETPDAMVTKTAETALLEFWKESAKIWRQRTMHQMETHD